MATKYEEYTTGETAFDRAMDDDYRGQGFTVGTVGADEDFAIYSIKILAYRFGSPGVVTVELYEVNGSGKPTGDALATGTRDCDDFTLDSGGAWYEFLISGFTCKASTKYVFYFKDTNATIANTIRIGIDKVVSTYGGGDYTYTTDGGSIWSVQGGYDMLFEVWGTEPAVAFMTPRKYW